VNSTVEIAHGITRLLHQKEGRITSSCTGLPRSQLHHDQESLSSPLISELVNQLCGAKFFTKLDVQWGYQNVWMKEGDEWKAAFCTNRGLYEPLVMFFRLTNSPSTFQMMMNNIFQDLIMEGVVCVYLDDILIFMKGIEEHRHVMQLVLERLRQYKLFL
jgi:Reverse transcriptase (RNA-dependent DNA polymerase)